MAEWSKAPDSSSGPRLIQSILFYSSFFSNLCCNYKKKKKETVEHPYLFLFSLFVNRT